MKTWLKILLAVLIVVGLTVAGYFYWQNPKSNNGGSEVSVLTDKIGKLMLLPADETPSIATVTDKSKLSGQVFFNNSENDDKVLFYPLAGKAILYRPKTNQIIEVGPISAKDQPQIVVPTVVVMVADLKVVVANGTQINGLATKWGKNIRNLMNNVGTISTITAKGNYQATVVVDLKENLGSQAAELAGKLDAKVISLPLIEDKPEGDLLVIIGGDKQ